MALQLQHTGSFSRPGPIGRGIRLAAGLAIVYMVLPLIDFRFGNTLYVTDIGLWVGIIFMLVLVNDIVNIGFGRDFGTWPRSITIWLMVLGGLGDFIITGSAWGEIISLVIAVELLVILGYLGTSYLVAAALAVPG